MLPHLVAYIKKGGVERRRLFLCPRFYVSYFVAPQKNVLAMLF